MPKQALGDQKQAAAFFATPDKAMIFYVPFACLYVLRQILNRLTDARMMCDCRLNEKADLRVQVVQKLLADPVGGPAFAVILCPAQGEFFALCPVNQTAVRSHVPSFPWSMRPV
jgi:hypothetical protein